MALIASRPGYQELLAAARRHDFDVMVVEDISRLWRNRAEFGPRSAELEDLGIHCLTCVGDGTRRDGWGLVIQIKQAVAEHARREASYRTRRGLEGKARRWPASPRVATPTGTSPHATRYVGVALLEACSANFSRMRSFCNPTIQEGICGRNLAVRRKPCG